MADAGAAELIAVFESIFAQRCCQLSLTALVAYEHAITLKPEIRLFWKRKITGATVVFFFNRYLLLLLWTIPWIPVYTDERPVLGVVLFILYICPFAVNLIRFWYGLTGIYDPVAGCLNTESTTPGLRRIVVSRIALLSRIPLMCADVMMVGITWFSLRSAGSLRATAAGRNAPWFAHVLLRDGTISFLVLLTLNILQVVSETQLQVLSNIGAFVNPVSAVIVSRILLNLQAASRRTGPMVLGHNRTPSGAPLLAKDRAMESISTDVSIGNTSDTVSISGTVGHEYAGIPLESVPAMRL
ncbi:hypothetical protein K466DRAFT_600432 [Polyporus arcularius HHB13444]|uniref:DUF6533 domain-containing protein n=1 Tax=Polyporus arcularius HHB13444 TaxID=1314778 RepID=A0A5C3P9I5_9APHY|nr:hypothetical protein K466DRAFT_600432 [Polyporus arcularius HHB13444]